MSGNNPMTPFGHIGGGLLVASAVEMIILN
jgi:hypothetical protein